MERLEEKAVLSEREFSDLTGRHYASFMKLALRKTYGGSICGFTAEDIVQEALRKAWDNIEKFTPGSNFKAWVNRIIINIFINLYRKNQRQDQNASSLTDEYGRERDDYSLDDSSLIDPVLICTDINGEVRAAIEEAMIPVHARILVLREVHDMQYREIATALDIPIGSVMSGLFRARKAVRENEVLAEYFGNEYL